MGKRFIFYRSVIVSSILLFVVLNCTRSPQSNYVEPITADDATLQTRFKSVWKEIEAAEFDSTVQSNAAKEMYALYLGNPDSDERNRAISYAFMMWGNIGETEVLEEALKKIPYDSEVWHDIVPYLPNAFGRHDYRNVEKAFLFMDQLHPKLTNTLSKSQTLYSLLDYYEFRNEQKFYDATNQIIELSADSYFVNSAKKKLNAHENLNIGNPAPDFTASFLSGESFTLSQKETDYLLLDFWATWCGPCLADLPELKQIHTDFAGSKFQIIGISLDEQLTDLTSYLEQKPLAWPQIYQQNTWNDTITTPYSILNIPMNYLIGPDGDIVAKDLSMEELRTELEEVLGN